MKNSREIEDAFDLCLLEWYQKSMREPYAQYYLYFQKSTAEHDGGLLILQNAPANSNWELAHPETIRGTIEQIKNKYRETLRTLPIISIRSQFRLGAERRKDGKEHETSRILRGISYPRTGQNQQYKIMDIR